MPHLRLGFESSRTGVMASEEAQLKTFPKDDPRSEKEFEEIPFEEAHGLDTQSTPEEQEAKSNAKNPKAPEAENRGNGCL